MARCKNIPRIGKTRVTCAICGAIMLRWPSKIRGNPLCSKECRGEFTRRRVIGSGHPCWKGGRKTTPYGYVFVYVGYDHPSANYQGCIQEHRLVMEQHLGRRLKRSEVVHHINGIRNDNRIENLRLCASNSEHVRQHHPDRPEFCWCGKPHAARGLCHSHYYKLHYRTNGFKSS